MRRIHIAFFALALLAGFAPEAQAQSQAPDGFWVSGGFHTYAGRGGGVPGFRVDGGFPVGPIAIVLPLTFDVRGNIRLFTLAPGVQYEYRLDQIEMAGLLSIFGEVGIGFFTAHERYNDFFGDRISSSYAGGLLRMSVGARYYMENPSGLFFFLNPIGFSAFLRNNGWASYEFSGGVGWRF
jgi:hypothetical protein